MELLKKRKQDQIDLLESTRRELEKKDPTLSGKHNKPKSIPRVYTTVNPKTKLQMLTEQDRITARTALGMDPTSKNEVATLDLSPVKRASSLKKLKRARS